MFYKVTQAESFLEPARCVTGPRLYQIRSLDYSPQAEAFGAAWPLKTTHICAGRIMEIIKHYCKYSEAATGEDWIEHRQLRIP